MKKFIFTLLLAAASFAGHAQLVQSSSLIVTKNKLPDIARGYQQSVDVGYTSQMSLDYNDLLSVNYIGGMRFNNAFFLGAGTGFNFRLNHPMINIRTKNMMALNAVNIPLYVHFRAYFLKSRATPFFAMSLGGRFSTKRTRQPDGNAEYSTCGMLVSPQIGVNVRTSPKGSIYVTAGFNGQTMPTRGHGIYGPDNYEPAPIKSEFQYGIDVHIGFTF